MDSQHEISEAIEATTRSQETHSHRRLRMSPLASAAFLAMGIIACSMVVQTSNAQQPEPSGAEPDRGDIDIGARSTESGNAERNEAAARANQESSQSSDRTQDLESADGEAETGIAAAGSRGTVSATATIEPVGGGQARGEASFVETEEGLEIVVTMSGLEPGEHGIHIHENGDCSGPAAEAAGHHFNPDDSPHGAPTNDASTRHAGDLGNIMADESGEAELGMTDDILTVEGERGVAGKAIVVHSGEDDLMSQPSGESGDPVACGVIETSARG